MESLLDVHRLIHTYGAWRGNSHPSSVYQRLVASRRSSRETLSCLIVRSYISSLACQREEKRWQRCEKKALSEVPAGLLHPFTLLSLFTVQQTLSFTLQIYYASVE